MLLIQRWIQKQQSFCHESFCKNKLKLNADCRKLNRNNWEFKLFKHYWIIVTLTLQFQYILLWETSNWIFIWRFSVFFSMFRVLCRFTFFFLSHTRNIRVTILSNIKRKTFFFFVPFVDDVADVSTIILLFLFLLVIINTKQPENIVSRVWRKYRTECNFTILWWTYLNVENCVLRNRFSSKTTLFTTFNWYWIELSHETLLFVFRIQC